MPDPEVERKDGVEMTVEEAKRTFGETLNRVGFGGERIIIKRHGKSVAALVPMKDLEAIGVVPAAASVNE